MARTSAFAFKGQNADVRRIAEVLGVTNILEGSVRRSGHRLRVTAQLIHAADGMRLWSERYDRQMEDLFENESGSPHWTISATGWFEKRRKVQNLRHYFAWRSRPDSSFGKSPFEFQASG
jgi:hypothetical protein